MIERITDNMHEEGYDGEWYSYIHNMDYYRVRYLEGEFTVWQAVGTDMVLIDTPEVRYILREVKDGLNEQ